MATGAYSQTLNNYSWSLRCENWAAITTSHLLHQCTCIQRNISDYNKALFWKKNNHKIYTLQSTLETILAMTRARHRITWGYSLRKRAWVGKSTSEHTNQQLKLLWPMCFLTEGVNKTILKWHGHRLRLKYFDFGLRHASKFVLFQPLLAVRIVPKWQIYTNHEDKKCFTGLLPFSDLFKGFPPPVSFSMLGEFANA